MNLSDGEGVFIIYTGGTIGSVPKDKNDPLSPLAPASLDQIMEFIPNYNKSDRTILIAQQRINLGLYSWSEPIDSSNIKFEDWIQMAHVIKANYNNYEGFVILHGTDTLSYTASALSFMLENLNKPIIVTGAQKPISQIRSDAVQNFVISIEIAAAKSLGGTIVPEVCVFFRDELYRGCRTTKLSASSYNAFGSPNFPPLGRVGERIVIDRLESGGSAQALHIIDTLEPNIVAMTIFPGMSLQIFNNMLNVEGLRGIIMQTYGSGNAPSTPDFLDAIDKIITSGRIILNITQCKSGEVELGLYDVSAGLLPRGVISGMDMTPEAALTKMSVILGSEQDIEIAADEMQMNLKGEQRLSIFNLHFPSGSVGMAETLIVRPSRAMVHGLNRYQSTKLQRAILQLMGLQIPGEKKGRIELKAYIDLPDANEQTQEEGNPHFLGRSLKRWTGNTGVENVFFTVTEQARMFVDNQHNNTLSIINLGSSPFSWQKLNLAFFADC